MSRRQGTAQNPPTNQPPGLLGESQLPPPSWLWAQCPPSFFPADTLPHRILSGHNSSVTSLLYLRGWSARFDPSWLVSGSQDSCVIWWDMFTGEILHQFSLQAGPVTHLLLSSENYRVSTEQPLLSPGRQALLLACSGPRCGSQHLQLRGRISSQLTWKTSACNVLPVRAEEAGSGPVGSSLLDGLGNGRPGKSCRASLCPQASVLTGMTQCRIPL